jgi:hypothetical protein
LYEHLGCTISASTRFTQVSPMRGGIFLWMQKGDPVIGQRCNPGQAQQSLPLPLS